MNLKESIVTAASKIGGTAGYVLGTAEGWMLRLPRPLKAATNHELQKLLISSLAAAASNTYRAVSGKTTSPSLVDRRLTKSGRVMSGVCLALSAPLAFFAAHELIIRLAQPDNTADLLSYDLDKALKEFMSANDIK